MKKTCRKMILSKGGGEEDRCSSFPVKDSLYCWRHTKGYKPHTGINKPEKRKKILRKSLQYREVQSAALVASSLMGLIQMIVRKEIRELQITVKD